MYHSHSNDHTVFFTESSVGLSLFQAAQLVLVSPRLFSRSLLLQDARLDLSGMTITVYRHWQREKPSESVQFQELSKDVLSCLFPVYLRRVFGVFHLPSEYAVCLFFLTSL